MVAFLGFMSFQCFPGNLYPLLFCSALVRPLRRALPEVGGAFDHPMPRPKPSALRVEFGVAPLLGPLHASYIMWHDVKSEQLSLAHILSATNVSTILHSEYIKSL